MAQTVLLARDGAVATITLNRPERRNALGDDLLAELGAVLGELRDDAATRVVVVTGAPPVFSAGAEAGLKRTMSAAERREAFARRRSRFRRLFERVTTALESLEQPTIAMINGHAVGGGWGLALACDFGWAAADAEGFLERA
ncbi:MAG TPA: enoyl-CoA hydratase/isomerase family protein [Candidatus Tectomicrobia bacterium]|nr:enoyl-CoA hydratase/isomerase family protein [Candidatus Tectomicrobia bacterium]